VRVLIGLSSGVAASRRRHGAPSTTKELDMSRKSYGRPVCTVHNGRLWLNVLEGKGPFRGSFLTREAAAAVGRSHAIDSKTVHVIYDPDGTIVESRSYEEGRRPAA
jgi:hypothetical protein